MTAHVCYGIQFPEGMIFPWNKDHTEGDINNLLEQWWSEQKNGFEPTEDIYDENGNELEGITQEQKENYAHEYDVFNANNPCPFTLINYNTDERPMYILALTYLLYTGTPKFPKILDMQDLYMSATRTYIPRNILINFCVDHEIEINNQELQWYLSSYWE